MRRQRRAVGVLLILIAACFLAGLPGSALPTESTASTGRWDWVINRIDDGAARIVAAIIAQPTILLGALGVAVPMIVWHVPAARRCRRRDPQRLFTAEQRRTGFRWAGHRCEMTRFGVFRCRRRAQQGDHWLPWSKGGATRMENFVAACARCNRAKSDHRPTLGQTWLLRRRRRRYLLAALGNRPHLGSPTSQH